MEKLTPFSPEWERKREEERAARRKNSDEYIQAGMETDKNRLKNVFVEHQAKVDAAQQARDEEREKIREDLKRSGRLLEDLGNIQRKLNDL